MTEQNISLEGSLTVTTFDGRAIGDTQISSGVFNVGYEKLVDGFIPTLVVGLDTSIFDPNRSSVNIPLSIDIDITRTDNPCTATVKDDTSIIITGSSDFNFTMPEDSYVGEFAIVDFARANLSDTWFIPKGTDLKVTYTFKLTLRAPSSIITIGDVDFLVTTNIVVPDYTNYQWYHFIRTSGAYMRTTGADYLKPVEEVITIQKFTKIKNDNNILLSLESLQSINPIAETVPGVVEHHPLVNVVLGNEAWEVTYTFEDAGDGLPILGSNERIGVQELYNVLTEETI